MELINQTPIVADLSVTELEGTPHRHGFLVAKATFLVRSDGSVRIDDQAPFPILSADQETEFGLLPRDDLPKEDAKLEVIVLGRAYARGRSEMLVELAVGSDRRSLVVAGDRWWVSAEGGGRFSEPQPFESMPLTWDRAFGGSEACWLDADSVMDLDHAWNKYGRGFNAPKMAEDIGKAFRTPKGFPRLSPDYLRMLPNIEHPLARVGTWFDEPRPYCWATVPMDIGAHMQRAYDHFVQHKEPMSEEETIRILCHRASPDWIIDIPPMDTVVRLSGMTPSGLWTFRIPRLRVLGDYELGDRQGVRELQPHLLMLLPDESRFYLVYRHYFSIVEPDKDTSRSWRLRLAEGWYS